MKIVNTALDGKLSLADKVWNDAMETAALHCEDKARVLYSANGDSESWVWPAGKRLQEAAIELRAAKRGL